MKILGILIIIATFVRFSEQESCHLRELDTCVEKGLIPLRKVIVPQTEEQMDEHCKYFKESYDCLRNYRNRCTTSFQRDLFSFITEDAEAILKDFCTAGNEYRKEFLKYAECLADFWSVRPCEADAKAAFERLNSTSARQMTLVCCTYKRLFQCGFDIVKPKCGEGALKYLGTFVSIFISNLPNIICNSYDHESQECTSILPPLGTTPKDDGQQSALFRFILVFYGDFIK